MRRTKWLALLAIGCAWVTSALPAAAQGEPVSSKTWVGRYEAFEEFLRTADIERTSDVATGVLGIQRAYFKPGGLAASAALRSTRPGKHNGFWESYKGDIAAYKLDRLLQLDMVPPTVERRNDAMLVSVQVWSEDTKMLKEIQANNLRPSNIERYNFQLRRQKVFQNLVEREGAFL